MELIIDNTFEKTAHDLGYVSFEEFARKNLKRELQEKIHEYQKIVKSLEAKYGMDYVEFSTRVIDKNDLVLKKFEIFEKEDDDFAWQDSIDFFQIYSSKLKSL